MFDCKTSRGSLCFRGVKITLKIVFCFRGAHEQVRMFLKKSSFGTSRMPGPVSVYVAVKDFKLSVVVGYQTVRMDRALDFEMDSSGRTSEQNGFKLD